MRTQTGGLAAHRATGLTTLCWCLRIDRADGVRLAMTSADNALVIDIGDGAGVQTYRPDRGLMPSAIKQEIGFSADPMEVTGPFDPSGITIADILAGRYHDAEFVLFEASQTASGVMILQRGHIGNPRVAGAMWVMELRGIEDRYNQTHEVLTAQTCRTHLGSPLCKYPMDPAAWSAGIVAAAPVAFDAGLRTYRKPTVANDRWYEATTAGTGGGTEPTWPTTLDATVVDGTITWKAIRPRRFAATVASITDEARIILTITTDAPADWLHQGTIQFTSGALASLKRREIKDWNVSTKLLTLLEPLPILPAPGDTLIIDARCDLSLQHCRDRHANTHNIRAEPFTIGSDKLYQASQPGSGS